MAGVGDCCDCTVGLPVVCVVPSRLVLLDFDFVWCGLLFVFGSFVNWSVGLRGCCARFGLWVLNCGFGVRRGVLQIY